jgi:hypothetical protein
MPTKKKEEDFTDAGLVKRHNLKGDDAANILDDEDSTDSGLVARYKLTGDDAANIMDTEGQRNARLKDGRRGTAKGYRKVK